MIKDNILNPGNIPQYSEKEIFDVLFHGKNVKVERIVSTGQITPEGQWYDQELDEWVVLLQGEATIKFDEDEDVILKKGDYLLIPAHKRHRVTYTSANPFCVWLAIHGNIQI